MASPLPESSKRNADHVRSGSEAAFHQRHFHFIFPRGGAMSIRIPARGLGGSLTAALLGLQVACSHKCILVFLALAYVVAPSCNRPIAEALLKQRSPVRNGLYDVDGALNTFSPTRAPGVFSLHPSGVFKGSIAAGSRDEELF